MSYSKYYRHKLSDLEKLVYDDLLTGFLRREKSVKTAPLCADQIQKIVTAVNFDNPKLYYVNFSQLRTRHCTDCTEIYLSYRISEETHRECEQQLKQIVKNIRNHLYGKSEEEVVLFMHDWLVRRCKYGECEAVENAGHSIVGALLYSKCVCEGFAKAFKYLADAMMVRAIVVVGASINSDGKEECHAWNIVKMKKQCFHVDVTFDHLYEGAYCSKGYYLLTTEEILKDHRFDSTNGLPVVPECDVESNVLPIVKGTYQLIEFLRSEWEKGADVSEVRLSKGFPTEKLFSMLRSKLIPEDAVWYNQIKAFWYKNMAETLLVCWKKNSL